MVSTLEQMQVPNETGPGVRRSKRLLLQFFMDTSRNLIIISKTVKRSSSVISEKGRNLTGFYDKPLQALKNPKRNVTTQKIRLQIGVMSDQLSLSLYMAIS